MKMCLDMIRVFTFFFTNFFLQVIYGFGCFIVWVSPLAQTYLLPRSLLPVRGRVVSRGPAA